MVWSLALGVRLV